MRKVFFFVMIFTMFFDVVCFHAMGAAERTEKKNNASFVRDVTIPDGTIMAPGQTFTKTWEIRNSGSTTWKGYHLAFVDGDQMGAPSSVEVPETAPGVTVAITIPMTAPIEAGPHQGNWDMRSNDGDFFGHKIWVLLLVKAKMPPIAGQVTGQRPILYISADGDEPIIAGVNPNGDPLGILVRSSRQKCILCSEASGPV